MRRGGAAAPPLFLLDRDGVCVRQCGGKQLLYAGDGFGASLRQKPAGQGLFLHGCLLIRLEGGEILHCEGIEDGGLLVEHLHAVLIDLVGEDLRLRQCDGDRGAADGHLRPVQVHPGLDGAVVGKDEGLGGEGDFHPVEVVAALELGHVGVGVGDRGQLPDLRQLILQGRPCLFSLSQTGRRTTARPESRRRPPGRREGCPATGTGLSSGGGGVLSQCS